MKSIVSTTDLQAAVDVLRLAAKETSASPTAGAVMIEAELEPQMLRLRTDNGAIHIQARVPAKIATAGELIVSAERLNRLLLLANGESVRMHSAAEAKIAEIECGSTKAQLPCWPKEEFLSRINAIPLTDHSFEPSRCELSLKKLQETLHDIRQCWHRDSTAGYIHQGVHFKGGDRLKVEICDGRMLHIAYLDAGILVDATVDTKFIDIIRALPADEAEACIVSFYRNACTVELGDITVRSQLLDGQYPDTERNLPPPSDKTFTVLKAELERALKIIQVVAPRDISTARFEVTNTEVIINANTPEIGQVREAIKAENAYEVTFNINAARLLSSLKCIKGDDVTLQIDDPLSAVVIREGSNFIAVIALIRTFDQIK